MIVIVSNEKDVSTNRVIDWLHFYKQNIIRINGEDLWQISNSVDVQISNNEEDVILNVNNKQIDLSQISSVWFRRDSHSHLYNKYRESFSEINDETYKTLIKGLDFELEASKKALYSLFSFNKNNILGVFENTAPNKINVLKIAKNNGLLIPKSIVTNSKKKLESFYKNCNKKIITKAVKDGVEFRLTTNKKSTRYLQYTELIDDEVIKQLPSYFFPSLFQEKIDKKYEIRVFYIRGECYAMAIFSQDDEQTKVDFRRYNFDKGNRNIPLELSLDIKNKIELLMNDLGLNTGSIDLIKTKQNEIVFLEVNPVGQYGMVSSPCNYNLDEIIAKKLISND